MRTKVKDALETYDWGEVSRTLSAEELVEVEAGRWRTVEACAERHLERAQRIAAEVDRLWGDVEGMAEDAAARGLHVPGELRERLSVGARGLPVVRRLHGELLEVIAYQLDRDR